MMLEISWLMITKANGVRVKVAGEEERHDDRDADTSV
jgi:hypothetical protein